MAQEASHHHHNTSTTTTADPAVNPGKGHASKDKFMGGIKETLGTVLHAEGMKESGREQKREGDAEAFAAGKGKKHYDPALARKGVGIQHKHMGPNPKKITEGPCAGCKEGTCQIGHDYDAAICHSCTQGHCDAGHVKSAGLPLKDAHLHGDHVARSAPCCNDYAVAGHRCQGSSNIMPGHNVAYNAAACPECSAGSCGNTSHSVRDKALMKKSKTKRSAQEKELRRKEKAEHAKHHGGGHAHHDTTTTHRTHGDRSTADFSRDLDREHISNTRAVSELDMQDRREQEKLHGKLHTCKPKHHAAHTARGVHVCDACGMQL